MNCRMFSGYSFLVGVSRFFMLEDLLLLKICSPVVSLTINPQLLFDVLYVSMAYPSYPVVQPQFRREIRKKLDTSPNILCNCLLIIGLVIGLGVRQLWVGIVHAWWLHEENQQ